MHFPAESAERDTRPVVGIYKYLSMRILTDKVARPRHFIGQVIGYECFGMLVRVPIRGSVAYTPFEGIRREIVGSVFDR